MHGLGSAAHQMPLYPLPGLTAAFGALAVTTGWCVGTATTLATEAAFTAGTALGEIATSGMAWAGAAGCAAVSTSTLAATKTEKPAESLA